MKPKKILFRADSSSEIGLGHIKRDLVYATRLSSDNINFASQELPGNINHTIPYPVHTLKSTKVDELLDLCKGLDITHLIVDNYSFTKEDEKKVKQSSSIKLSVFDDTYEEHFCDEVLNHNLGSDAKKYRHKVPSFCKISLIPPLIRREFFEEKQHTHSKQGIFLSLGGSDPANLTLKVLKYLKRHRVPVHVGLTSSNSNLKSLKAYANVNRWITLHIDANIAELLNTCKLAIITPSVLAAEALFMGVPVISIRTADNQIEVERFLKKERFQTLKSSEIHKLKNRALLQNARIHRPTLVYDNTVFSFSLHKASVYALYDLFDLVNDSEVRRNSFSTDPISLEEHTRWLQKVLDDSSVQLYTVRSNTHELIAQVRFNKIDKKAIISLSISQDFRGKSLATKIIRKGCEIFLTSHPKALIEAQIKEENIASQKSFAKADFDCYKREEKTLYYLYGKEHE